MKTKLTFLVCKIFQNMLVKWEVISTFVNYNDIAVKVNPVIRHNTTTNKNQLDKYGTLIEKNKTTSTSTKPLAKILTTIKETRLSWNVKHKLNKKNPLRTRIPLSKIYPQKSNLQLKQVSAHQLPKIENFDKTHITKFKSPTKTNICIPIPLNRKLRQNPYYKIQISN